MKSDIVF